MYALLLTALLPTDSALAAPPSIPPVQDRVFTPPMIEGDWIVLAAEQNGQPVPEAMHMAVTVRDNIMRFAISSGEDNPPRALRLEFGPKCSIRAIELNGEGLMGLLTARVQTGVYAITGDYLAISLHDEEGQSGQLGQADIQQSPTPTCTLFLQRSDISHSN